MPFTLSQVVVLVHWVIVCKVCLWVNVRKLAANSRRGRLAPQCASDPARYTLHQLLLVVAVLPQLSQ